MDCLALLLIFLCFGFAVIQSAAVDIEVGEARNNVHLDCPETIMFHDQREADEYARKTNTVNGNQVFLTEAANTMGAACLDGSVPDFYWRPGTGDGAHKFHVYLEGGGWCAGIDTAVTECLAQDKCLHRATTSLGSSTFDGVSHNYDNGYMSTKSKINPLAYNWNTVYVPYCDGFSFTGNNETVLTSGDTKLHFRGFRNLNALFQRLIKDYQFGAATDVLLSGCSAGGLSTYLHADYVRNTYVPNSAHFMAMPDSGFFLYWEKRGKYISQMQWIYDWGNVTDALNQECLAAQKTGEQWKCMFAQFTAPYIKSSLFPLQSRFDAWQTACILESTNDADISAFGANITTNFMNLELNCDGCASIHAAFLDSCHHHCGEWNDIVIDGLTSSQAQVQWYYQNNTHNRLWYQQQPYPCPDCCHQNS